MIAKLINFSLVFILSVINFITLIFPIMVIIFPVMLFFKGAFISMGIQVIFLFIFCVSVLMFIYILFDTLFGITVSKMAKGCVPIEKAKAIYAHEDILDAFNWLKERFDKPKVKLYISPSEKVNAYAIGSFRKESITITMGLLNHFHAESDYHETFVNAVHGVLGHEFSHLANKDFLPGLLVAANDSANSLVSRFVRTIFLIASNLIKIVPVIGGSISQIFIRIYNLFFHVTNFFFRFIFMPIYNFLQNWAGRSIEYRCDREAAYAYGGKKIAKALELLGPSSYFSIFSTHPRTKSRISHVEDEVPRAGIIGPNIFNSLLNYSMIIIILVTIFVSWKVADVEKLERTYKLEIKYPVLEKYNYYKNKLEYFTNQHF